jgi:hypothetical protein
MNRDANGRDGAAAGVLVTEKWVVTWSTAWGWETGESDTGDSAGCDANAAIAVGCEGSEAELWSREVPVDFDVLADVVWSELDPSVSVPGVPDIPFVPLDESADPAPSVLDGVGSPVALPSATLAAAPASDAGTSFVLDTSTLATDALFAVDGPAVEP